MAKIGTMHFTEQDKNRHKLREKNIFDGGKNFFEKATFFLLKKIAVPSLLFLLFYIPIFSAAPKRKSQIDVNLSEMNLTMANAILSDMELNPSRYEGKIVKMKGLFYIFNDFFSEEEKIDFADEGAIFGCMLPDTAGCCFKTLGFQLQKDLIAQIKIAPANYDEIIICGKFKTYDDNGDFFKGLCDCSLEVIKNNP